MEESKPLTLDTDLEIAILEREKVANILQKLAEEFNDSSPVKIEFREEKINNGMSSRFHISVKGREQQIGALEDVARVIDRHVRVYLICPHQKLHVN